VDIGSLSTKTVILDGAGRVLAKHLRRTGADSRAAAEAALAAVLEAGGVNREDLACIVATGYGRIRASYADRQVTEITCHGRGAHFLRPGTRTIVDIGGQDSKVIRVDPDGHIVDFAMNDKCAAGTGRFLEVMAAALEVGLNDMGRLSARSRRRVTVSSMCTVFAESEVVSLIAEGHAKEDIIRGLHEAVGARVATMARRVGVEDEVAMTGGVARNAGVVKALQAQLGRRLHIPADPQLVGALGAALVARDLAAKDGALRPERRDSCKP